jgi:hypothetical protein
MLRPQQAVQPQAPLQQQMQLVVLKVQQRQLACPHRCRRLLLHPVRRSGELHRW